MWIVRLALRRPYTVAVMSFMMLLLGILSLKTMLIDIFPTIDIPVVGVVWNFNGLSAEDMERRVTFLSERGISTTVNGVQKIESQSIAGIAILKIYFQPGTDIGAAIAQINSVSNTALRSMPPGMQPPAIMQFNASNVPVVQVTASSQTLPEEKIFDYSLNFIRLRLFTVPGLSTPAPYGGKSRQIMIDVDPKALAARGLSPYDVVTALQASNIIIPAGTARIGDKEYNVAMNSSPTSVEQFNTIPIKVVGNAVVTLGDVARVSDSYAEQTNIVHVNSKRATYLSILKKADASTLAVVEATKDLLPSIQKAAPEGLELKLDFDQSTFVQAAIDSVLKEAVISSILVSIMVLVFLGSWRSVVIVCTSIPLSIFTAIIGLKLTGNSINIMTLGGMSLAIGMLVDDATVEVENIHRNRLLGKPLTVAILDGAHQIAVPAIMATLAICIVFSPVVLLTGPARYLFTPMALSVVIAMLASYLLSRTLVPTLAQMFMAGEELHHDALHTADGHTNNHNALQSNGKAQSQSAIAKFARNFNRRRDEIFGRFQESYGRLLGTMLAHRTFTMLVALGVFALTLFLPFMVGTDFFPTTDTGLMKLHFRSPVGTRIENTEKLVLQAEDQIRKIIPADELETINDMIGVPTFFNLAFVSTDNTSGMDAEILIALKKEHHPTVGYMKKIREDLATNFPGCAVYFQPADIVSQVLNFGLSSPIDVQIEYANLDKSFIFARGLRDSLRQIPGTADVVIKQALDYPTLQLNVDRVRASELGLTQRDVANSMLISLSSSSLVAPSFFLNPMNNVNYFVAVQVPAKKINSVQSLLSMPITPPTAATLLQASNAVGAIDLPQSPAQTLGNIAALSTLSRPSQVNHATVQRVLDVTANVEGRDLGSVSADIEKKIASLGELPTGMKISVRGQNEVMQQSFRSLGLGIILAIVLVYLLMVILFQSWLDPFIIMVAVPGAWVGILWMLAITGTTINVVSLMGSIMSVGIAVSNSILLVSFANEVRIEKNLSAISGALEAGKTRLRPVLMTALAMILGMIPMALGMGEGGEQNAPLGRAVIGGLIVATVVTLFIVPVVYSLLRKKLPTLHLLEARFKAREQGLEFDETKMAVEKV